MLHVFLSETRVVTERCGVFNLRFDYSGYCVDPIPFLYFLLFLPHLSRCLSRLPFCSTSYLIFSSAYKKDIIILSSFRIVCQRSATILLLHFQMNRYSTRLVISHADSFGTLVISALLDSCTSNVCKSCYKEGLPYLVFVGKAKLLAIYCFLTYTIRIQLHYVVLEHYIFNIW